MLNHGLKLFLTVLLLSSVTAFAAGPVSKSIVKKADLEREEKKSAFTSSVSYKTSTNLQSSGEKRKFSHSLGFGLSYLITKKIDTSLTGGFGWKAQGQNIRKESENPSWDDLSVGIDYSDKFTETIFYSLGSAISFPTSFESNLEEIKGKLSLNTSLTLHFLEKTLSWSNSLDATKYIQTYDYSIVSGVSNADTTVTFTTGLGYKFAGGFSTRLGVSVWSTRLINGENTTGLANSAGFSLGYTHKIISVSAGYTFGNYDSTDGYQLMYFDDTKRIASLGVGIEF